MPSVDSNLRADSNLRVGVIHGPGSRITPVWFDLKRHKNTIREITNIWRDRQGERVRFMNWFMTWVRRVGGWRR
jgi:hypothetical protein